MVGVQAARAADDVVNIRTTMIDDDPWFVGADILRVLYGSPAGKGSAYLKLDPTEIAKVDRINFEPRCGHPHGPCLRVRPLQTDPALG